MVDRSVTLWRTTLRAGIAMLAVAAVGCGGADDPDVEAEGETPPSDVREWVIPMRPVDLRVEPDPTAGSVATVATGRPLERIDEPGPEAWIRVATWDDRRGWVEADAVVNPAVWSHYERALGGVPLDELRPAYPVEGGWLVEIPYGSPSFYEGTGAWVLADTARVSRVSRLGTVEACPGDRKRVAWLDGGRSADAIRPPIDRARAALPAGGAPAVRGLAVAPVSDPEAGLVEAVLRTAERSGAQPDRVTWWRIDGGSSWATVEWAGEEPRAAAFVALPEAEGYEIRTVVAPRPAEPGVNGSAPRPVFAYETDGVARPTLFVVASNHYDGGRVDLYFARPDDYGRVWTGYTWGCGE